MKLIVLMLMVYLTCQKKYVGEKVSQEFDDTFAAANCPKGCSLCTNGTGMNSQCTACLPQYFLNAPACVPKFNGRQRSDPIPWWGLILLIIGIFSTIPLIMVITRMIFYRHGPNPNTYKLLSQQDKKN